MYRWIKTTEGNLLNMRHVTGITYVENYRGHGPNVTATDGHCDVSLLKGTEADCRAFISSLVDELNAPDKIVMGEFEVSELRREFLQMGESLQDIARQIARMGT